MRKALLILLLSANIATIFASDYVPESPTRMQEKDPDALGFAQGRFYVSAGIGVLNLNAALIRGLKNSIAPNWKGMTIDKMPTLFGKAEYAIARHHGVGLNFAYSGLDVNVSMDSLTRFNVPVRGTLSYRSWSLLGRYNFHFIAEKDLDVYLGLGVGFRNSKLTVTDNDPDKNRWNFPIDLGFASKYIPNSLSIPTVGADLTLGFRYNFLPFMGVYGEMGLAKSLLQGGLVFRI